MRGSTPRDPKWFVLIAVGAGTFMSALDASAVNTILPLISRSFDAPVSTVQWLVTVYLLVVSGLLLSFGRLGDMRGHKSIYIAGFAIFVLSSALCGLAPSAVAVISFRALQGFGAAMLFANSPAILVKNFPATQRGQVLGLQASMTYLGLTVGPALGGWLAGAFGWRAVFYVNVPIGLLALGLCVRFIPRDSGRADSGQFDLAGAMTWTLALVGLIFALNRGHEWGWKSSPVAATLVVSGLLLVAFIHIERRVREPMLDLSLFLRPAFSTSAASAVLNFICAYTVAFLLPFYLIQGRGFSAAMTGMLLTAHSLVRVAAAPLSGSFSDRVGTRVPSMLGMAVLSIGLFLLSELGAQSGLGYLLFALAIAGLGTGIFVSPNNSALMGSAPLNRQGIAAGVLATSRNVGMALGVGLAGAVFSTVISRAEGANRPDAVIAAAAAGFLVAAGVAVLGVLTIAMGYLFGREPK